MRVDAVAVEDAVTGRTARAQLSAEPRDGAPLSLQFLMDFLSYVDVVGHAWRLRVSLPSSLLRQTNWREVSSFVRLYQTSGSGKPSTAYKHEIIHAKWHEPFANLFSR